MAMVVVRVARMAASLRVGSHEGWGSMSRAVSDGGPIERATRRGRGNFSRGLEDAQLWSGNCRVADTVRHW